MMDWAANCDIAAKMKCGITVYDGNLSREDAEKLAYHELLEAMKRDSVLADGENDENVS